MKIKMKIIRTILAILMAFITIVPIFTATLIYCVFYIITDALLILMATICDWAGYPEVALEYLRANVRGKKYN